MRKSLLFLLLISLGLLVGRDYAVDGEGVTITGPQIWVGVFTDATHMDGTWEAGDSEATGTWTAIKQ